MRSRVRMVAWKPGCSRRGVRAFYLQLMVEYDGDAELQPFRMDELVQAGLSPEALRTLVQWATSSRAA